MQVDVIMLGVKDVERAKQFYVEGLGARIDQEYPGFARCTLGTGSALALYAWDAVAQDAGVASEGSGFRGVSFHFLPESRDEVDRAMRSAEEAGATVVTAAVATQWGGYEGYFSDLDGHLWKVATAP